MRRFCLFLAICLSFECYAQNIPVPPTPDFDKMLGIKREGEKHFLFTGDGFVSAKDRTQNYIVFEFKEKSAAELKSSLLSSLSDIFNSPKDAISTIGENIIQIDGYAIDVYTVQIGNSFYKRDFSYSLIIRIKDGKIRYDAPKIKTIFTEWPLGNDKVPLDMNKPLNVLIEIQDHNRIHNYFNSLIPRINNKILISDDW